MMEDLICCEPKVTRFLAVTEIMPFEPVSPRIAAVEIESGREKLLQALHNYEHIHFDLSKGVLNQNELLSQDKQNEEESEEYKRSLHL